MLLELLQKNKSSFLLLLVLVILPISVSSVSLLYFAKFESTITAFSIYKWILFYSITAFTMSFALTPTTYIALVTGYFLGWIGLIGLVPSYLIASLIGFTLAQQFDKGTFLNQLKASKKIDQIINNITINEFKVIFLARISPALPFAMMNVFLSFMNVSLNNFITAGVLGMLPRTLLSVWIGMQAKDIILMLQGKESIDWAQLIVVGLFVISTLGLFKIITRSLPKA